MACFLCRCVRGNSCEGAVWSVTGVMDRPPPHPAHPLMFGHWTVALRQQTTDIVDAPPQLQPDGRPAPPNDCTDQITSFVSLQMCCCHGLQLGSTLEVKLHMNDFPRSPESTLHSPPLIGEYSPSGGADNALAPHLIDETRRPTKTKQMFRKHSSRLRFSRPARSERKKVRRFGCFFLSSLADS